MLTVNNVTKKYGGFLALEDISLTFENGIYGLLAPNGAGKTTLIKMLATLLFPTKGEIQWEGVNIHALNEKYRGILGYLPQDFGYYKGYTPKQYLRYLSALKSVDLKAADARIDELLELVGLSGVTDKKMKKLSGGMIKRVGIAQAMIANPKLLIFDEPTAGLDPSERVRFRDIIRDFSAERIVIISTNIVSDIESIADYVVMIKDRKLLSCTPPAVLYEQFGGGLEDVFMQIYSVKNTSKMRKDCI